MTARTLAAVRVCRALLPAAVLMVLVAGSALAGDWPAWRGPDRTGVSAEADWRTDWDANPPAVLWKAELGKGFSTVSVSDGRAYTMGNSGGVDHVWCMDAETGKLVWQHRYRCQPHQYEGPRCTPTVDGDRVYTLSNRGHLFCLDAKTGKVVWFIETPGLVGSKPPQWGFACSPLVLGNHLIVDVGPVVALDKMTGKIAWKAGADPAGYGSPYAFDQGGKTLIASFNAHGPIIVEADGGAVVARERWKTAWDVNATTPIVSNGTIFYSSGYNTGAAVFKLAGNALQEVWRNKNMRNHANNCVLWKGYLYGFDGQVNEGPLTCLAYDTGEKRWSEPTIRAGGLMVAAGTIIGMSAKGECVLVTASPDACQILGRKKLFEKKDTCWTQPVLANGRIYCRSHKGDLACLDVRKN